MSSTVSARNDGAGNLGGVDVPNVIPDHLNASDFTLFNTSPEMIAAFQMWLDVLQSSDDAAGIAITRQQWLEGGRLVFNPYEAPSPETLAKMTPEMRDFLQLHQGIDVWDSVTHAVYWNPYSALQIVDSHGNVIGVQSPGTALVHEDTHGIDGNVEDHIRNPTPVWRNDAEYIATQYANASAASRGEVERDHYGLPINVDLRVDNPTVHTGLDASGNTVWMKTNPNGQIETGPAYNFQKIPLVWGPDESIPPDPGQAPTFGTTTLGNGHIVDTGGIDLSSFDWGSLFGNGDQAIIDALGGPELLQGIAGLELVIELIGIANMQDWGWNYVE